MKLPGVLQRIGKNKETFIFNGESVKNRLACCIIALTDRDLQIDWLESIMKWWWKHDRQQQDTSCRGHERRGRLVGNSAAT